MHVLILGKQKNTMPKLGALWLGMALHILKTTPQLRNDLFTELQVAGFMLVLNPLAFLRTLRRIARPQNCHHLQSRHNDVTGGATASHLPVPQDFGSKTEDADGKIVFGRVPRPPRGIHRA